MRALVSILVSIVLFSSCSKDSCACEIERVLLIKNSLLDTTLNNKYIIELTNSAVTDCDCTSLGVLGFYDLDTTFNAHPAFDLIYGSSQSFSTRRLYLPKEYSLGKDGVFFEVMFEGAQSYHDLQMMRILHESFFRSNARMVCLAKDKPRVFAKSKGFRIDSYSYDELVKNPYVYD